MPVDDLKTGDKVYVLRGSDKPSPTMRSISVYEYTFKRSTEKRIYLYCRSGEVFLQKTHRSVFYDEVSLKQRLRSIRAKRLEWARKSVKELEALDSVPYHTVPAGDEPGTAKGPIKL